MQVFKTFFKISLRFLPSVIIYIVIFGILSMVLPNTVQNSNEKTFTAAKLKIAVIDNDNSTISQGLCEYLDEIHTIVDIGTDDETWRDELFFHNVIYILVINDGLEENIESGIYENLITAYEDPASNSSYIVASQVNTYLNTVKGYMLADMSADDSVKEASKTVAKETEVSYLNEDNVQTQSLSGVFYYFNYIPYIMLCMLINSLGPMLVIWNRPEIKSRTAISSLSLTQRTSALFGAAATFAIFVFTLLIAFGAVTYSNDFFCRKGALYLLNAFVYLIVTISITFLVSQLTRHVNMLNMFSNAIGLSSSFLCGIFVQRSLLPDKVIAFSKCLPTYWYINVTEELKNFDGSLSNNAIISIGVQLLFAAAIFAISLAIIKIKEQRSNPA